MPFDKNLKRLRQNLEDLEKGASKVIEWTLHSTEWKIGKEIRENWPIDTGLSYGKWGFEPSEILGGRGIFKIYNHATVAEQRRRRGVRPLQRGGDNKYAKWVYAKGDGILRRPIAPGIVKHAIITATPTIEENFYRILDKYLAKRGKSR